MAGNPDQESRGANGRYVRTPETAERDAKAAELRAQRWTLQEIADELGYSTRERARTAINRALRSITQPAAENLIRAEAEHLDVLYEEALAVLDRDHLTVSHGRIITVKDPESGVETPLLDDAPKLAAIDRLVKIRESFRRLHGLDQPAKVNVSGGVKYEVVGVDPEQLK